MAEEARRLLPDLSVEDLDSHPPGLRAKPVPPGSKEAFADMVVREDPPGSGVIHLIGIESPGLTASFAIGAYVREMASTFASSSGGA